MKVVPSLTVLTKEQAAANESFFTLVEWNDGKPYKQNQTSTFSRVGDSIASSIYDSSGNFVMDAFQVSTSCTANNSKEGTHYTIVVDPGQSYINGRKVQTTSNYKIDMIKGDDYETYTASDLKWPTSYVMTGPVEWRADLGIEHWWSGNVHFEPVHGKPSLKEALKDMPEGWDEIFDTSDEDFVRNENAWNEAEESIQRLENESRLKKHFKVSPGVDIREYD